MTEDFAQLGRRVIFSSLPVISVAVAHDKEVIRTIKAAVSEGLAEAILIGDKGKIEELIGEEKISSPVSIEHEADEEAACRKAIGLIKEGKADMLMKGIVNSSIFLKAVLEDEKKNGKGGFLSHMAAFQVPGFKRLLYFSDGGMNIAPDLEAKKNIIINGINGLHRLGIPCPRVAVITANENVDSKIPASVHAAELSKMWKDGAFPDCILEGPVTMDVALSKEAAVHKGINSKVSGETDLFIGPDIQAGNIVGKVLIYCARAKMAGVILGASYPIVMTSRAENAEGKFNSIALAAALTERSGE
ncbi:bifunctional enoyl-CoA hydratase/phosphate acetyltransferase [Bacillota bacterium]